MLPPSTDRWTREQKFLTLGIRSELSASAIASLRARSSALDWDAVIDLAEAHDVWFRLLTNVKAASVEPPAQVLSRLEQRLIGTTGQNLARVAQLARLLGWLQAEGVVALAFKGPTLAGAARRPIGSRSFGDLDLLVSRADVPRARAVMKAHGYVQVDRPERIDSLHPDTGREDGFETHDPNMAPVEIQVNISSWPLAVRLEPEQLISRARTIEIAGVPIRTLGPEDLLLVLTVHGMRNNWAVLRYITDIETAAAAALDWTTVLLRARSARMRRVLAVGLLLACDLVGAAVPPPALKMARTDSTAVRLSAEITNRLFEPAGWFHTHVRQDWVVLRSRERHSDKLRYALRKLVFDQLVRRADELRIRSRGPATS